MSNASAARRWPPGLPVEWSPPVTAHPPRAAATASAEAVRTMTDAELVARAVGGDPGGLRRSRRAAPPRRLHGLPPIRPSSRRRERFGAGGLRARVAGPAAIQGRRGVLDLAVPHRGEHLPEQGGEQGLAGPSRWRMRIGSRTHARSGPVWISSARNAPRRYGERFGRCQTSSVRRSSFVSITSCLTSRLPTCWGARSGP